jgi:two-component sensor histidine kinase/HAMP domain-containing protein
MQPSKGMSIRTKIIIITIAVLGIVFTIDSFVSYRVLVDEYTQAVILQATGIAQSLKLQLERIMKLGIPLHEIIGFESQCQNVLSDSDILSYALVMDATGVILFHNDHAQQGQRMPISWSQDLIKPEKPLVHTVATFGKRGYVIILPVFGEHGELIAWVSVGVPETLITRRTGNFLRSAVAIAIVFLSLASGVLVLTLSRLVNAPLSRLLAVITDIREKGTYSRQIVNIESQDEIGQLAAAFDQMMFEIRKSHQEIHEYARTLEAKVQERTVALQTTNDQLRRENEERKRAEHQLQNSLLEKEVLLKEIHHRVKNNMQVMSSLLNLQINQLQDTHAQSLFQESQQRIKTMSLIHERLYQSDNLTNINFREYVSTLVQNLYASYRTTLTNNIRLQIHIEDIRFDLDTAIPCGLIINELVSNALKYAFPQQRDGTLRVTLTRQPERWYELEIQDDGVGMPVAFDLNQMETLGVQLVKGLVEEQLGGTLRLTPHPGTTWHIGFPSADKHR